MVDRNIITVRVEQIEEHLNKLSHYKELSYEQFLNDTVVQDISEYNLFQTVNHIIGIIQHIVVDEEYGLPQSYYEAGQILCDKGIINKEDLLLLKKMIGFRNIVGHDYIGIDKKVVYSILTQGVQDIKKIISKITERFL